VLLEIKHETDLNKFSVIVPIMSPIIRFSELIGRFQQALDELASAEQVTPDNAWLHFNRARVLDWQGDQAQAARVSCLRSLVLESPPLNRPKRQMAQRRLHELGWHT
jgi:hypothetical protein